MLNYLAIWKLNDGFEPGRIADSGHSALVPAQNFPTADGTIAVICFKEKFWTRLCRLVGRPELADDPRFPTFRERLANKAVLIPILRDVFASRTTAEWIALLSGEVPCAPVNDLAAALADPQVAARRMIVEVEHPVRGTIREVGTPVKVDGAHPPLRPAPRLGEGTVALLEEAGFSREEIDGLVSDGVCLGVWRG